MEIIEKKAKVFAIDNNKYLPKEFIEEVSASDVRYITGFKGKIVKKGVSIEEETKIPQFWSLINAEPKSQNFVQAVNDYWDLYETLIPVGAITNNIVTGGISLDAGYTKDEQGMIHPNVLEDYILFNLLSDDDTVCTDIEEWSARGNYVFFLIMEENIEKLIKDTTLDKKKFNNIVHELLKEDIDKLKNLVRVYSKAYTTYEIEKMDKDKVDAAIMEMAEKEKEALEKGYNDKNLAKRVKLVEYLNSGAIELKDGSYFIGEDKIADKELDTLRYIHDATNAKVILELDKQVMIFKKREIENA